MLIDAHAHVNFNAYKDDAPEVIRRALDNDIWMINIGSQSSTSERAVKIAEQYPEGVYACVGLHPMHLFSAEVDEQEAGANFITREENFNHDFYYQLGQHPKTVGIGECGLDYYYLKIQGAEFEAVKSKQKQVFIQHIELANELGLPLMLHCRGSKDNPEDAYLDMLEILKEQQKMTGITGMIHCFGSTSEIAQKFVDLNFCVGFTGIVTFSNAKELQQVARELSLKNIITETDCPYLAPQPMRGKRNEPMYVKYVAEKIADLKQCAIAEVENQIFGNALRIFKKISPQTI